MKTYTAEEVREAALAAGKTVIPHHECSSCGSMVSYVVSHGDLYFDGSCDCAALCGWSPRSWQSAADWINMQSDPRWRQEIAERFGIVESAQESAQPRTEAANDQLSD